MTDVSTTCAEAIFRVKIIILAHLDNIALHVLSTFPCVQFSKLQCEFSLHYQKRNCSNIHLVLNRNLSGEYQYEYRFLMLFSTDNCCITVILLGKSPFFKTWSINFSKKKNKENKTKLIVTKGKFFKAHSFFSRPGHPDK